jgi:hypothetical protein
MSKQPFRKGDPVLITSPGHRRDGQTGIVSEDRPGIFMGTWSVDIEGQTYGFWASELTIIKQDRASDPLTHQKDTSS